MTVASAPSCPNVDLARDAASAAAKSTRPLESPCGHGLRGHEGSEDDPGEPLPPALEYQASSAEGTHFVRLLDDPTAPEPARQRGAVRPVEDFSAGAGPKRGQQHRRPDTRKAEPGQEALRDPPAQIDAQDGGRPLRACALHPVCELDGPSAPFAVSTDEAGGLAVACAVPQYFVEAADDHDVGAGVPDDAGRD